MRHFHAFIVALLLALPAGVRADYTAVVNPNSVTVNNFLGWGTSLCWWANVIGNYPNRTNYVDLAFSQLKLNIVRYNIGGGQNPNISNSSQAYRTMIPGFEPANGVWNWEADTNQRWVLQQAEARGANIVEAFANSPPWWMCVNSNVDGNVEGTNNLQTDCEVPFADYLATVASNLTVLDGDHFDYVTPMNEPHQATTNATQEFCHMSLDQQGRLIADLRAALNTSLPAAGVDAPQDIDEVQSYNDLTTYSSATLANLSLFSTHTYGGTDAANMKNFAAAHHTTLWMSEYGDNDTSGMTMARHIYNDITQMAVPAWINWQVVDPTWGLLYNNLLAPGTSGYNPNYTINEKFYVMGQFSEFVRPGCKIISVNDTNTLAAYNPTNSTLVLVMVNSGSSSLNVTYDLSDFGPVSWQVSATQTASGENMASLAVPAVANEQFTAAIAGQSVTTFVLTTNAVPPAIAGEDPDSGGIITIYAGQTPTFSVSASGGGLQYQWYRNGAAITGATNSSYTAGGLLANEGRSFYCTISNTAGTTNSETWRVAVISGPTASYPTAALALHPVGFWPLNETEQGGGDDGVIAEDYAGGNNGVYTNVVLGQMSYDATTDPTATSALFGYAASANSCVYGIPGPDFSLPDGSNAEFTVAAWVSSTGNNGLNTPTIAAKGYYYGEEYALDAGAGDCYRFSVRDAAAAAYNANSTLSLSSSGVWYHLVGVCDEANGQVLLYINGVLAADATIPVAGGIVDSSPTPMTIGARASSATSGFNQQFPGYISDVAIYNYALSASQIQTLYQSGVTLPPAGLTLSAGDGGAMQLNWNYGVLQSATNVAGPYQDVTNVSAPYSVPLTNSLQFFRIREN